MIKKRAVCLPPSVMLPSQEPSAFDRKAASEIPSAEAQRRFGIAGGKNRLRFPKASGCGLGLSG